MTQQGDGGDRTESSLLSLSPVGTVPEDSGSCVPGVGKQSGQGLELRPGARPPPPLASTSLHLSGPVKGGLGSSWAQGQM